MYSRISSLYWVSMFHFEAFLQLFEWFQCNQHYMCIFFELLRVFIYNCKFRQPSTMFNIGFPNFSQAENVFRFPWNFCENSTNVNKEKFHVVLTIMCMMTCRSWHHVWILMRVLLHYSKDAKKVVSTPALKIDRRRSYIFVKRTI
jgi:hypothetical protein